MQGGVSARLPGAAGVHATGPPIPVLQIEGSVSKGERGGGFDFARYHHAVAPKAYAAADLYAPYLTANPDGIAAAGRQQKR